MEQLQQDEWIELRSNTHRLLRQRNHINRSKHWPLLQFLVMPSFADTWCLDFVRTGDDLAAYYTTWRSGHDLQAFAAAAERLKHPRPYIPTLESVRLDESEKRVASIMSRMGAILIPMHAMTNLVSLDGTEHELQVGDGRMGVVLRWHNQLPHEWPPELHALISDLKDMVCRVAAQASAQRVERESS